MMEKDTLSDWRQPFPLAVRPLRYEVPKSYVRRLIDANYLPENIVGFLIDKARQENPSMPHDEALREVGEVCGGLQEGFFARVRPRSPAHPDGTRCDRCLTGMGTQYMCRKCAHGQVVEQYSLIAPNVCLKHRLWLGSGCFPMEQYEVEDDAIAGEKLYRRLASSGRIDAPLLMQLRSSFRVRSIQRGGERDDAHLLGMMQVAAVITSPTFVLSFFDPKYNFSEARSILATHVGKVLPDEPDPVVASLWSFYRPMFLRIRRYQEGGQSSMLWTGHDYGLTTELVRRWSIPLLPSEPFRRYYDHEPPAPVSSNQSAALARALPRKVPSTYHPDRNGSKAEEETGLAKSDQAWWKCEFGHPFERHRQAADESRFCPYCLRAAALPGFNGADVTNPLLARYFDYENNGAMTLDAILSGSDVVARWLCSEGHSSSQRFTRQAEGAKCSICRGRIALAGVNDLATSHPLHARWWSSEENAGVLSDQVTANGREKAWWTCPRGHLYGRSPSLQVKSKYCPTCYRIYRNSAIMLTSTQLTVALIA